MQHRYESPMGSLVITHEAEVVKAASFSQDMSIALFESTHPIKHDLDRYFYHQEPLTSPIRLPEGPKFTKSVWLELLNVPYGTYTTYLAIAKALGNPKSVRAVGQACKRNPIGLFVPCHRVLSTKGKLTGYSGKDFVHLKEALLKHERSL